MKRGVSLLEMVLALAILGLIGLFLMNLLPSAALVNRRAEHQTAAAGWARELVDFAAATDFDQFRNGTYDKNNPGPFDTLLADRTQGDTVVLSAQAEVSRVPGVPRRRLFKLRVTVSWNERGRALSVTTERRFSAVLK